jgi:hypothetical protein
MQEGQGWRKAALLTRLELGRGVVESVSEGEATLSVGVVDLDGNTVRGKDNVSGLGGLAAGHVLGEGDAEDDCKGREVSESEKEEERWIKDKRLMGIFNFAMAQAAESVVAAPPISALISFIAAPGLREIPPESKVIPLPTKASGCSFLSAAPL